MFYKSTCRKKENKKKLLSQFFEKVPQNLLITMIKTNFTITFFESEICFKINAKFILITNTHPVTFLDLHFLVVLKT